MYTAAANCKGYQHLKCGFEGRTKRSTGM